MKTSTLAIVLVVFSIHSSLGQEYLSKGSNILTGTLGINLSNSESENEDYLQTNENRYYSTTAYYGKFMADNFAIGLGLGYSYNEGLNSYAYTDPNQLPSEWLRTTHNLSTRLFARKYFPINEKFGGYLCSDFYYQLAKHETKRETGDSELRNTNTLGLSAGFGIYYFILNKLSLSANLIRVNPYYTFANTENESEDYYLDYKVFGFNMNVINSFSFSVNYHF